MSIDRETPIGKAVESPVTDDDRSEVQGHLRAKMTEANPEQILNEEDDATSEVEGHARQRMTEAAPGHILQDDDDSTPEVEGHLRAK